MIATFKDFRVFRYQSEDRLGIHIDENQTQSKSLCFDWLLLMVTLCLHLSSHIILHIYQPLRSGRI